MMRTLTRRILRLESLFPTPTEEVPVYRRAFYFCEPLLTLLGRMSPKYGEEAHRELLAVEGKSFRNAHLSELALPVLRYFESHVLESRPLQLPDEVLERYLSNRYASPSLKCGVCRYLLPINWANPGPPAPENFQWCPLCGGKVGLVGSFPRLTAVASRDVAMG
jgi:hypothetical protein